LRDPHLLFGPHRQRPAKLREAARREGEPGLEEPVELGEWLVVERDEVELRGVDARLAQAIRDGVGREGRVVLLPREALFLRRREELTVADEAGGAVVVEGADPEDVHRRAERAPSVRGGASARASGLDGHREQVLARSLGARADEG